MVFFKLKKFFIAKIGRIFIIFFEIKLGKTNNILLYLSFGILYSKVSV